MLGDGGIVRTAVIAEYRLVDLFLAEHLSRVSGQMLADGVFAFRQRQRRITVVQRFGSQVEVKRTAPHAAGGYARLPPQMRRHTGAQLRHAKWLRQVIVAAKAQSAADRLESAKAKAADADKAKSDARAAYDAAVKEANAKKAAADAAKLQIAKGSLGFFESRGSEDAVKVLTDPNTTKYLSSIDLGAEGDATSLENMKASLKYIRECNDLRAKEGLPPLKVSDVLMAMSQADVDWSDDNYNHAKQYVIGENLAWGYDDPFDGWYTDEKASYDKQKAEGVEHPQGTGHYTNIVNSYCDATGFALSGSYSDDAYENDVTHGQVFSHCSGDDNIVIAGSQGNIVSVGTLYTIDDYEAAFDAYYDGLMNADQAYKDAQARVEAAKAALDKADAAATEAHAALDEAAKASEQSRTERTEAQSKLADATSKAQDAQTRLADATAAKSTADKAATDAKATLDAAKSDATAAKTAEQSATDRLAQAKKDLDQAQKTYDQAVDAQAKALDRVDALTDAKTALDKAQAEYDAAKAAYDQAKSDADAKTAALSDARSKLDAADKALDQAKADRKAASQAKAKADEAAAKLAAAMGAEKLILLTDVRGLLRDPHDEDTLIHVVHTYEVPELVAKGVISGGMIPKMDCCVDAIAGGVERVHILDGRIPHSILIELLSDQGIGTMLKKED